MSPKGYNLQLGGNCHYSLSEIKEKISKKMKGRKIFDILEADKTQKPFYTVINGLITIKDKQYPIKLPDGYYIIRKLTVKECMRLQTVPETYDMSVISDTRCYQCLGNGWTVDVITHLIKSALG